MPTTVTREIACYSDSTVLSIGFYLNHVLLVWKIEDDGRVFCASLNVLLFYTSFILCSSSFCPLFQRQLNSEIDEMF